MKCLFTNCDNECVLNIVEARERRFFREAYFCVQHGKAFLDRYLFAPEVPERLSASDAHYVPFEIAIVSIPKDSYFGTMYLREVNGTRAFVLQSGICEAWAMIWLLKDVSVGRPLTHDIIPNLANEFGAQIVDIIVDDFRPNGKIYTAKVRLQHLGREIAIDIRPSDAFNLALASAVPILISEYVLGKENGSGKENA